MSPIYCFQTSTNFHMVGPSSDRIQKVMKCWWPLLSSENCLLLENLWSDGFCNDMSLPWGGWVICRLDRHWSDCKWQIHQVRILSDDCLLNSLYPLPDFHNTDTVSRHSEGNNFLPSSSFKTQTCGGGSLSPQSIYCNLQFTKILKLHVLK